MSLSAEQSPRRESADAVWPLKEILYPPHSEASVRYKIVCQNRNGPCSLIAIVNILILRDQISILPPGRKTVSYEYLAGLVADFLVNANVNDGDLNNALAVLPTTQKGMNLNPLFTGVSSFRSEDGGGELKLFQLCNIILVHGWLTDPSSPEHPVLAKAGDYDSALNLIVASEDSTADGEERDILVRDAVVIREFLENNPTQLTYHGLWSLFALDRGLYAFIRNSHLSVLFKQTRADNTSALWLLVTDSNFAREPSIVWESLEDIEGAASRFVDSDLRASSTLGGDFAGRTAAQVQAEIDGPPITAEYNADLELAKQLQAEEDELAAHLERTRISKANNANPNASTNANRPIRPTESSPSRERTSTSARPVDVGAGRSSQQSSSSYYTQPMRPRPPVNLNQSQSHSQSPSPSQSAPPPHHPQTVPPPPTNSKIQPAGNAPKPKPKQKKPDCVIM